MNPIIQLLNQLRQTVIESAVDMTNTAQDKLTSGSLSDLEQAVMWQAAALSHRRLASDIELVRSMFITNQLEDLRGLVDEAIDEDDLVDVQHPGNVIRLLPNEEP